METKMGPSYANLFVGYVENKFFSNYHGPKPWLTPETSAFLIFYGGNSTFINSFDKTNFLLYCSSFGDQCS